MNLEVGLTPIVTAKELRLEVHVRPDNEPAEQFVVRISLVEGEIGSRDYARLGPHIDDTVQRSSHYVRSRFSELSTKRLQIIAKGFERYNRRPLPKIRFDSCLTDPTDGDLVAAVERLVDEVEVAIIVHSDPFPSLREKIEASLDKINLQKDRLVVTGGRNLEVDSHSRVVAAYEPNVKVEVPDLLDYATVSPAGHVAGLMSRFDRDRGAHYTPANEILRGVVDLDDSTEIVDGDHTSGYVNRIRCLPGQGIVVWGGRTLDPSPEGKFIAHQRFLHRLVRGIRRVAFPLVAEANGPPLWRALKRAVTTLLLQAFRGGALKGARPEEAFYVTCDETNNPYEERVNGRVTCEIGYALASPMESISIRVTIGEGGDLEVFDS